MVDSNLRTVREAVLVAVGAAVLAVAAGGLGVWARGGGDQVLDGGSLGRPEQRAALPTQQTAAQRGGLPPRAQDVEELLPPRWPWWKDAEVQKTVGLSAAQVERLDAIVRERQHEMAAFIEEYRKQAAAINRMAAERKVSAEEFAIQAASFYALWAKLNESRTIMLYRMSHELSDAQYKKLQEYRDRRSRGRSNSPNR